MQQQVRCQATDHVGAQLIDDILLANLRSLTDLQSRAFALDVALVRALGGGYTANVPSNASNRSPA